MAGFAEEVPHSLGADAARDRLDMFLETVGQKYKGQINNMDGSWDENTLNYSFTTFGIKVKGTMEVEPELVKLKGDVPITAMMFKGKIAGSMKSALEKALAS